ncbi:MAG: DUF5666 domain-containing protein, partial [Pseudomonadota bacterium]
GLDGSGGRKGLDGSGLKGLDGSGGRKGLDGSGFKGLDGSGGRKGLDGSGLKGLDGSGGRKGLDGSGLKGLDGSGGRKGLDGSGFKGLDGSGGRKGLDGSGLKGLDGSGGRKGLDGSGFAPLLILGPIESKDNSQIQIFGQTVKGALNSSELSVGDYVAVRGFFTIDGSVFVESIERFDETYVPGVSVAFLQGVVTAENADGSIRIGNTRVFTSSGVSTNAKVGDLVDVFGSSFGHGSLSADSISR